MRVLDLNLKKLQERRKAMGVSQTTFARRCGCSRSMITKIEAGQKIPGANLRERIEMALEGGQAATGGMHSRGIIPFRDEAEAKEMHEIWCRRFGGRSQK